MEGEDYHRFKFSVDEISDTDDHYAHSTTGYFGWNLQKPAMTFEATRQKEHGQLSAMAVYSLLLGFGHQVAPIFEDQLRDPCPKIDSKVYEGLKPEYYEEKCH